MGRVVKKKRPARMTAIDLFAGAGGATAGLKAAGYVVIGAIELDRDAAASYRLNHPEVTLLESDIVDCDAAEFRSQLRIKPGVVSLLKACPPCQAFSTLGTGDGDDPRNDLVDEVWRFIREFRPRAWVVENVPGIRDDDRLESLVRRCRAVGYAVSQYMVDAADFGIPQRRRRHLVVGISGGSGLLPDAIADLFPDYPVSKHATAGPVLDKARAIDASSDPVHRARTLKPMTVKRLAAIPAGGSRFDLPAHLVLKCHADIGHSGATGPYGRIARNRPAPTMTTRCTTPACGAFAHPTENRGLTLREAALLQTFDANYRFVGGYGSIERQIGNAVPVRLAEIVGRAAGLLVAMAEERTHQLTR
jgi:DNA (cytosine-5)-methyltransferase 1